MEKHREISRQISDFPLISRKIRKTRDRCGKKKKRM
jgi:hypothetical protein